MTALQKALVGAALVAAIGVGVFEMRRHGRFSEQIRTLQQEQIVLTEEVQQLQD